MEKVKEQQTSILCPKCGSPLEPLFSDDEGKQPFTLQYGKRHEPAYDCSNPNCFGLWTKTSIRIFREMKEKERKRNRK